MFNIAFAIDDVILIRDYSNTDGNYIPETPSKLGLYPKFAPGIFVDTSYVEPQNVIQGHDGSITPAFGDYRDELLLEFEKRDMFMLLRYLKYFVDTMRKNKVVWGLGRGSSVSSYVLYLIGVHKINSIYYDIPINEFLK